MGDIALNGSGKVTCQGCGEIRIKVKSMREICTERDEVRREEIELRALDGKPSDSVGGLWQEPIGGSSNGRNEGERPGRVGHSAASRREGEH